GPSINGVRSSVGTRGRAFSSGRLPAFGPLPEPPFAHEAGVASLVLGLHHPPRGDELAALEDGAHPVSRGELPPGAGLVDLANVLDRDDPPPPGVLPRGIAAPLDLGDVVLGTACHAP